MRYLIIAVIVVVFFVVVPMSAIVADNETKERVDLPDEYNPNPKVETDNGSKTGVEGNPPIEFFDSVVETDTIIFVIDRSGSMGCRYTGLVRDLEGEVVYNKTKMEATVLEIKRSIMDMALAIKFNIVFYTYRTALRPIIYPWQKDLVPADDRNKALAFLWLDANSQPAGATPTADGTIDGGIKSKADTIMLLTDGYPNIYQHRAITPSGGAFEITANAIKAANTTNKTIHTYFLSFGNTSTNAKCGQMMQKIAKENGPGTYTELGGK